MASSVSYRANYNLGTFSPVSSFTVSGADIGTAASDRVVVVSMLCGYDSGTTHAAPSVTVGGISATLRGSIEVEDSVSFYICQYTASVPIGTTANIVVTADSGNLSEFYGIGVHAVYGTDAAPASTVTDATDTFTLSSNVVSGSIFVGFVVSQDSTNTPTFTWVGATENFDEPHPDFSRLTYSGASVRATSTESPRTITADASDSDLTILGGVGLVFAESTAPTATFAITEASDTAAANATVAWNLALAATGSADVASFNSTATWSITLSATEAADTASFELEQNQAVTFAINEAADTADFEVDTGDKAVTFAITETADAAVLAVTAAHTASFAPTEAADTLAANVVLDHILAFGLTEATDTASVALTSAWLATLASTEAPDDIEMFIGTGYNITLAGREPRDQASFVAVSGWRKSSSYFSVPIDNDEVDSGASSSNY